MPAVHPHPPPRDAVSQFARRAAAGQVRFAGSDLDVLRTVLQELKVPVESQVLVFSKTSLQGRLVRPGNPRALFFSDSVYVGWVPGGLIEAAAIDPELGAVFYSLDPQDARDARRTFVRETSCLRCHEGRETGDVPGLLARSVVAGDSGELVSIKPVENVDDQTPFERRWGGWYVTGYVGRQSHLGNAFGAEREGRAFLDPTDRRPMELSGFFDASRYAAATSDVVSLMVFDHQLAVHNSLVRAALGFRGALDAGAGRGDGCHRRTGRRAGLGSHPRFGS